MLITDQHPLNKSIMVSVLGEPNAGKSTLINQLIGTDLSIVSSRPQTTRNHFHCVTTVDRTEIVFVDTPGVHSSNKEFNKRLNNQAVEGSEGVELNLLLIDLTGEVMAQFTEFVQNFDATLGRTWVIFSKCDLIERAGELPFGEVIEKARDIIPSIEKHFVVSGKNGDNVHELIGALCDTAKSGPHLYPKGDISNKNQRFFTMEYIREQLFDLLRDEVPYETAVVIDEYHDFAEHGEDSQLVCHISASILVNRQSQRAIIIGAKGSMIKEIGTRARRKIEAMVGGQVHLNLHAKVSPNWFKNNFVLEEIGLPRAPNSNRVWKKK